MRNALDEINLINWLVEHGGSVIRYLTAVELIGDDPNVDLITKRLLDCNLVKRWLERLTTDLGFNQLHGADPSTYESAIGKLTQMGCRQGMQPFDDKTRVFREWFQQVAGIPLGFTYSWVPFLRVLVAAFLSRSGYWDDQTLKDFLTYRLDVLAPIARTRRYDLYRDSEGVPGIPKAFRGRPLIAPALTAGGEMRFPLIYDIHLLANVPQHLKVPSFHEKVDAVIGYILDPAYQSLPEGYGIIRADRRKYYAMGWSVHLPGYDGMTEDHPQAGRFVQRMVLMSNFALARKSSWFQRGVEFLRGYQTERGRYCFPRRFLPESRSGYWVVGAYMGLEENRRTPKVLELESTYWMLKILRAAKD